MENYHYEFDLEPLPYGYDALEPYIDELTMELHHDRHLKAYVDKLNAALADYPNYQAWSLEKLITDSGWLPEDIRVSVRHNAGGVYNHNFYFANLSPDGGGAPSGELGGKIKDTYGSYEDFKEKFKKCALDVFGSGYAWLTTDKKGNLRIIETKNQETPLTLGLCPVMTIDVWEHAYYLKHYNKRADYVDDWFNALDIKMAEKNYSERIK